MSSMSSMSSMMSMRSMTRIAVPRPWLLPWTLLALLASGCEDPRSADADADADAAEETTEGDDDDRAFTDEDDAADDADDAPAGPPASAEIDELRADPGDPDAIYGGTFVGACGWPSTVELGGSCSGTLVHPEVVIYAAHCGASYNKIYLGESISTPARVVSPESCAIFPGGGPGEGDDFAICKLAEPITDVPIVPILMGCETAALAEGAEVTLVGFGNADEGPYGVKREVRAKIQGLKGDEIFIGGGGKDTCQGDSGGPVFIQLADGTWRVFGITSYGGACGTGGYYSMMHVGMAWFEDTTGVDLTPCHDADGTWNPGPECGHFLLSPGVGGGSWAQGCAAGPRSGAYSATCGAPHSEDPGPNPFVCADCKGFTSRHGAGHVIPSDAR